MGLSDTIRRWIDPPAVGRVPVRAGGPASVSTPAASPDLGAGRAAALPIDRLDPAVHSWLMRELPILGAEGVLSPAQVTALARRYGVAASATSGVATAPAMLADDVASAESSVKAAGSSSAGVNDAGGPAASADPAAGATARAVSARRPPAPALVPFLSEHAVSIVLYLGAFLVVAAVVIFLAYTWELLGGSVKLGMVAALTAGFLLGARVCLPRPSVRPAGRTFLALGAMLVPATVAAAYTFVFAGGPLPQAAFWLIGALLSGALHAALSLRLGSRGYGLLAALAPPVAASALVSLVGLVEAWWLPAGSSAVASGLAAARRLGSAPLAFGLRAVGYVLLPANALVSLAALVESGSERWAASFCLLIMAIALGWEATRPSRAWAVGPIAALVLSPFILLAVGFADERLAYLGAVALTSWVYLGVARRLAGNQAVAWDVAGAVLALLPPLVTWSDDRQSALFFASATLLLAVQARAHRAPVAAVPALLAADLLYVKLLAVIGSPESPAWLLGVALWPLALAWTAVAVFAVRRWSWPFFAAALATAFVSAILTVERQQLSGGIAATYAVAAIVAAWRLASPPLVLLAAPWALLAGWQGAGWLGFGDAARATLMGVAGWPFIGASLVRAPVAPPTIGARGAYSWAAWARAAAILCALAGALIASGAYRDTDAWRVQVALGWVDLALVVAAGAWLGRPRDLAAGAALALVPALLALIGLSHPTDAQAYAIPAGAYLLVLGFVVRRDRRPGRLTAASVAALVGGAMLVLTSFGQSADTGRLVYTLLTLVEGLALLGLGIAVRWRVVVAVGVAGVVLIALRLLFDAIAALPGWLILGGSGLALLAIAVVLLLVRDRLARTGRVVAERWAGWD